jgi:two-component system cell cycle sensor histidine kinase/response regulator CckA
MDDDPDICHLASGMLASLDYKYDVARRGEEAVTLYKRYLNVGRPYDLVILDLTVIGGMGGEETYRELRELDPTVRAIVCSGYDSEEMTRHYLEMGLSGYLTKPFRLGDLSRVIKTVLG